MTGLRVIGEIYDRGDVTHSSDIYEWGDVTYNSDVKYIIGVMPHIWQERCHKAVMSNI